MTAPLDRARLRELAENATPGPWTVCGNQRDEWYVYALDARYESLPGNPSPVKVAWVPWEPSGGRHARDADYIAAASPDAVLALLDALDAAERERDATAGALATASAYAADVEAERDALAALLQRARTALADMDRACDRDLIDAIDALAAREPT